MEAPRFDRKTGEWIEPEKFCSLFDLGGKISGSSTSDASQMATVSYIPSVFDASSPPLVSTYPAGQGLATLNTAYPGAYANVGPTNSSSATAAGTSSTSTLLVLAVIGLAAYYFLRKKR